MAKTKTPAPPRSTEEITIELFGLIPVDDRGRAIELLTEFSMQLILSIAEDVTTMSQDGEE